MPKIRNVAKEIKSFTPRETFRFFSLRIPDVEGSKNICNLAREKNVKKIIFASSVAIYGFAKPNTDENGEINYFNDYGRTKFEAEKVYREWYEENPKERTLIIIRPTVIFGKGNRF